MGLVNSIFESVSSIDASIENKIYYPPDTPYELFNELNTDVSKLYVLKTEDDDKVPMVQIRPKYNAFPKKYIVFSHGNGSDIYSMFHYLKKLSNQLNVGIVCYDYVGYGLSRDKIPSEQLCYDSIKSVVKFLQKDYNLDNDSIYLVGQSLGTGITIDFASKNYWATPIILISPYKSICRVVFDTCFVTPIDKFTSLSKLKYINCPIKIFHGESDEVISIEHGREMYNNLKNKIFDPVWFENTGHNDILDNISPQEFMEVLDFDY
ncbi:alpha/beta hydrolase [Cotonvirus japonicus]|uniref:Alpha/beta hydrolase n=1 Tax=Cotonvirus japonicus TaxID=2811091 RepID=A0ABM7NSL1_9VIRU|nr:alpha/beta hydrolase [Cotonvirus japonicus]BCS83155.1 alpha/beta hydrolase [Cotonvirus japonicus]